jgi:hypothetical protein
MGIATFLDGCQLVAIRTVLVLEAPGERDAGHKRLYRGNRDRAAPVEMFRRRRRCNRKVLEDRLFRAGIHILLEAVQSAFTWVRKDPILPATAEDEFSSKFNAMR